MSQGYKLGLYLDPADPSASSQFQDVTANITGDELDTSSSMNPDGTFNLGFSDVDSDLLVLMGEVNTIIKDTNVIYLLTTLEPQTKYPNLQWTLAYFLTDPNTSDLDWSGTGLFIGAHNLTFNIPGAARLRMTFRSLQTGFTHPGS